MPKYSLLFDNTSAKSILDVYDSRTPSSTSPFIGFFWGEDNWYQVTCKHEELRYHTAGLISKSSRDS